MNISDKNNLNSKYDCKITFVLQSFKTKWSYKKKRHEYFMCIFSNHLNLTNFSLKYEDKIFPFP